MGLSDKPDRPAPSDGFIYGLKKAPALYIFRKSGYLPKPVLPLVKTRSIAGKNSIDSR